MVEIDALVQRLDLLEQEQRVHDSLETVAKARDDYRAL